MATATEGSVVAGLGWEAVATAMEAAATATEGLVVAGLGSEAVATATEAVARAAAAVAKVTVVAARELRPALQSWWVHRRFRP